MYECGWCCAPCCVADYSLAQEEGQDSRSAFSGRIELSDSSSIGYDDLLYLGRPGRSTSRRPVLSLTWPVGMPADPM